MNFKERHELAIKFRKGLFPSGRPSVKSKDLQVNVLGTFDAKSKQSLRAVANGIGVVHQSFR